MKSNAARVVLACLAVLAVSACSGSSRVPSRDAGVAIAGIDGRVTVIRPGQDTNAAYSQGLDLKNQGNCPAAVLKLRPVANMGPGYENAQTALGSCLLDTGAKNGELSADYLDGLTWLRRAADAGWPEAQGALATAHAFGPVAIRNGEEAAYWLALYETNPRKSRVGFAPMTAADADAIDKALTAAQKTAGAVRAAQWQRQVWLPPIQQLPAGGPGAERGPGGPGGFGGRERRERAFPT